MKEIKKVSIFILFHFVHEPIIMVFVDIKQLKSVIEVMQRYTVLLNFENKEIITNL